jgi:hypothetical protein
MYGGCRDLEVMLKIALCRRSTVEFGVGINEGQMLALGLGKGRWGRCSHFRHENRVLPGFFHYLNNNPCVSSSIGSFMPKSPNRSCAPAINDRHS